MKMSNRTTWSFREFNKNRTNNTGDTTINDIPHWVFRDKWVLETLEYSPGMLKIVDEIIVNAIDAIASGNGGDAVEVSYDAGVFSVYNNGTGIPLEVRDNGCWWPQNCFTVEYNSTNFSYDVNGTTGGVNGVGSKLTNIFSKWFEIETVGVFIQSDVVLKSHIDPTIQEVANTMSGVYLYKQRFEKNMEIIHPPCITPHAGKPYTRVTFLPDYNEVCRHAREKASNNWHLTNGDTIQALMRRRVLEAAVYLARFGASIRYNGQLVQANFEQFVTLHGTPKLCTTVWQNQWRFDVGLVWQDPLRTFDSNGKVTKIVTVGHRCIIIVNGVVTNDPSNLSDVILRKIEDFFMTQDVEKYGIGGKKDSEKKSNAKPGKFPTKFFRENVILILVFTYPKRHFDFKGQVKSAITFDKESLSNINSTMQFSQQFLAECWRISQPIMQSLFQPKNSGNRNVRLKLYEEAICLTKANQQAKALFVLEGNSAATLVRQLLDLRLKRDAYGLYSIQGVPMNSIKNSTCYEQGWKQLDSLTKNDGLQGLVNVLQLSYDRVSTPAYAKIIFATDQDHDGIGKICSLLICFFMLYFPHLVKSGFLARYRTPIIRVRYGTTRKNFYSQREFERWHTNLAMGKEENLTSVELEKILKTMKISYYKGLGTHSKYDIYEMATTFESDLVQISWDEAGEHLMHQLYGHDTAPRKLLLLRGIVDGDYSNPNNVSLSEHFTYESIEEQIGDIKRKLPNVFDGFTPCQNKVFTVIRKMTGEINVNTLTGRVIEKMNYVHGEASLQSVIMRMAQDFPGSNRIPTILSVSGSNGSQHGGRKDTAQARYTKITPSTLMKLYYPLRDDDLLIKRVEEGCEQEPVNYVPILPRVLLEDCKGIATGWNGRFVARDFKAVMSWVRFSIENKPFCGEMLGLPAIYPGMSVKIHKGKEYIFGTTFYARGIIQINQLPLHLWVTKLQASLTENAKYKDIVDKFIIVSSNPVNLQIYLMPGAWPKIESAWKKKFMQPHEEFFCLYQIATRNLNFCKDNLVSYSNINDIFCTWFAARKSLYKERLTKEQVLLKAKIEMQENILKYITTDWGLCRNNPQVNTNLSEKGYKRLNHTAITTTQFCGATELYARIYGDSASYEYIFNIREGMTNKTAKITETINKLKSDLNSAKTWRQVWTEELDEFERVRKN